MLIGELSEKTGFSRDTIRFYEKQGLISVGRKERRENNYKEYSADTLRRLLTIKVIKSFGFTLNETSEFLDLISSNQASCGNVATKASDKIRLIEEKIQELHSIKELLMESINSCQTHCTPDSPDNCSLLKIE